MSKKVSFGKGSVTEKMLKGLDIATDAVAGTIGPRGRNVYLSETYGNKIVNDGVAIANKVFLKDPEEDAGAFTIRNVCGEQNDKVGDGTTTVAILTQAIVHEALKRPENPMLIREALNAAGQRFIADLNAKAKPITLDDVERVALISAEDPKLASIVSSVIRTLGVKSVINVEDAKTLTTDYEIVDGYEAPIGYLSPHFADPKTGKATLTDVPVLVTDKKISNITDIKPLFDQFAKSGTGSCVIVCDDIEDAMLGMFVANKVTGRFNALVIKAHGDTLKDIEGATGAKMVSAQTGITFQNLDINTHLGHATKVTADAHKTTFVLGGGEYAKAYAEVLERQAENEENMYLKKKLEERASALRGGIAVIRVAAATDYEREYLKLKAEDAIKAVQAALEEGIVEGGGMALWSLAQRKPSGIGEEILSKALTSPLRKIIENAGKDYAEVLMNLPKGKGYDAKGDEYVDMFEAGIIDPVKVERVALQNAISSAGQFITTFAAIIDEPTEKES